MNGAKRSSFRDGLGLRMKAMGELGKVMEESANEAIQLLSQIGPDGNDLGTPQPCKSHSAFNLTKISS